MPVQHRYVEVAPGHTLLARRAAGQAARPGHVMVRTRTMPPFELAADRWEAGEVRE